MSPTELIDEVEAEQIGSASIPMRKRKINDQILDFKDFLDTQSLAPMSIANRMKAVNSFYKHYYIQIPISPRSEKLVLPLEENTIIPTKEDIRKVLEIADPLEKAIVLVGASSGLAVADICNLKLGDFNNGYDPDTGITKLRLRRVKTNFDFITFLTPETSKAVKAYIDFRNRIIKKEKRRAKQIDKQKTVNDYGYLFVCRHVPDEYLTTHDENLRKLDESTIISMYQSLAEDARINYKFGSWNTFRSHRLRKWFNNQLKKAGCDLETKEFLMAHRTRESRGSYNAQGQDPDGLKEKFKNFIPFLTIEKSLDISESEDFKRIKAEHETLLAEAEKHRVERTELQELRAEIEKLKQSQYKKHSRKKQLKESWKRITINMLILIKTGQKSIRHIDKEYQTTLIIKSGTLKIRIEFITMGYLTRV
jgi:site-specific recombinase XerD